MSSSPADFVFKIVIIGETGVGKSCLLLRFADDNFTESFLSTIGVDFKLKTVNIDGKTVKEEKFRTITSGYYRSAHGIILVYDITDITSFRNLRSWLDQIEMHAGPQVNKMIVGGENVNSLNNIQLGNKMDLAEQRQVSPKEGKELATSLGIPFAETSAKTAQNVQEAFVQLATQIQDRLANGGDSSDRRKTISTIKLDKQKEEKKGCC